jgi:metallo-beta-lactamase family protein
MRTWIIADGFPAWWRRLKTFRKTPEVTYLVHGEPDSAAALQQTIQQQLGWRVEIAKYMQRVELGSSG